MKEIETIDNEVILCDDGTKTLRHALLGEAYHSTRGSLAESDHVFIEAGFAQFRRPSLRILEAGFGTGINAILTLREARVRGVRTEYCSVERYPVSLDSVRGLDLQDYLTDEEYGRLLQMHRCAWDSDEEIDKFFALHKIYGDLLTAELPQAIDLVYYDAFAPDKQPELWSREQFARIFERMNPGGILVTYSAKGTVKENLRAAGFEVKRLRGALGKRHMVRAQKA